MKIPWTKVVLRVWEQLAALRVAEPFSQRSFSVTTSPVWVLCPTLWISCLSSCVACMLWVILQHTIKMEHDSAFEETYHACQAPGLALHCMVSFDSTREKVLTLSSFYMWDKSGSGKSHYAQSRSRMWLSWDPNFICLISIPQLSAPILYLRGRF